MDNFELYKACYRILRDNGADQDDAYAVSDALWDLFRPWAPVPDREHMDHEFGMTDCHCPRCGGQLRESEIPEYNYYCPSCDEDYYGFETRDGKETV